MRAPLILLAVALAGASVRAQMPNIPGLDDILNNRETRAGCSKGGCCLLSRSSWLAWHPGACGSADSAKSKPRPTGRRQCRCRPLASRTPHDSAPHPLHHPPPLPAAAMLEAAQKCGEPDGWRAGMACA